MDEKFKKESSELSEKEIQELKERWKKPDGQEFLKSVFIDNHKFPIFRYIQKPTSLENHLKGLQWMKDIGEIFPDFVIEWKEAQEPVEKFPIFDFRYCNFNEILKNENNPNNEYIEMYLPYADFTGSRIIGFDFSKSYLLRTNFEWCRLNGTKFSESRLDEADFSYLRSSDGAIFSGANCFKAKFIGANLEGVTCTGLKSDMGHCDFTKAKLRNATFKGTNFDKSTFYRTDLYKTNLQGAFLTNVKWHTQLKFKFRSIKPSLATNTSPDYWITLWNSLLKIPGISFFLKKKLLPYFRFQDTPISVEGTMISGADFANSRNFERYIKDEQFVLELIYNSKDDKFLFWITKLWAITCDYGRSLLRWTLVSITLILLFAYIFADFKYPQWLGNNFDETAKIIDYFNPKIDLGSTSPIFFSIVIFTTLGFINVGSNLDFATQFWTAIEVFLGYIMLGGLISIFANKLARRAA